MTIFVIVRATNPDSLRIAVQREFPNDHYELQQDEWLISTEGSPKGITDRLGITGEKPRTGSAIVFETSGYFGRASSDIWKWMKEKAEGADE